MRVLVTGAAGRLGTALRRRLTASDEFDLILSTGSRSTSARGSAVDLSDQAAVERLVTDSQPAAIVHLGAVVGAACELDPARTHAVNVEATRTLATAGDAVGATRFVFASTSAVYGDRYAMPVDESGAIDALSAYARSKLEAERTLEEVASSDSESTMQATALRIFNMFGDDFEDSLVWRLLHSSKDHPVALRGFDGFVRDYVHVDDVATAVIAAIRRPGAGGYDVVNIGSGMPLSNRSLVERLSGAHELHFTVEDGQPSYSAADITRARSLLGFAPSILP
jgi:UDP-glucose 4-epimerase